MSSFRNPFKQHYGSKKTVISKTKKEASTTQVSNEELFWKETEREFDRELRKVEQLDEDSKKIYKDAKKCVDCQTAQMKAETKLVHNLYNSSLSRENENLKAISDQWLQCIQHLDTMSQEMNATLIKTVVEPMKKFGTVIPSLQHQIKKREQLLQELNKCQAKVDKYIDREQTGPNKVKLSMSKKALEGAKSEFDAQNGTLMADMPKLYAGRINYFEPSFQALIKSQLKYYTDAHDTYATLASCLSPSDQQIEISNPFSDENEQDDPKTRRLQQKLSEIRALSITAD